MSRMKNEWDDKRKLPWMIKLMDNDTTNRIRLTIKKKKDWKKGGFSEKRANFNDI